MHQCIFVDGEHYTSLNRLVKGKFLVPNDILILMNPTSIYIHIPFCEKRCYYCDFNTYSGIDYLMEDYVNALCCEIKWMGSVCPEDILVHTIYFGGGTPSLLPIKLSEQILSQIQKEFHLTSKPEITIEANPGTIDFEKIKGYRNLGINRLSFGAQSFNERELQLLGRIHNTQQIIEGVELARKAGFSQINLDLMFGLPNQSFDDWKKSLCSALQLDVEHLSLYGLTIETGTVFGEWLKQGKISNIDEDQAADCYDLACDLLDQNHFEHYEISNWAKRDGDGRLLTCRHNLQYWKNLPYLGFGAGAHAFFNNLRIANVNHPYEYIKKI
ncbi:MAG: radical SAM family heme chaperone HemW, partial [Anaerolineales bacterium]